MLLVGTSVVRPRRTSLRQFLTKLNVCLSRPQFHSETFAGETEAHCHQKAGTSSDSRDPQDLRTTQAPPDGASPHGARYLVRLKGYSHLQRSRRARRAGTCNAVADAQEQEHLRRGQAPTRPSECWCAFTWILEQEKLL